MNLNLITNKFDKLSDTRDKYHFCIYFLISELMKVIGDLEIIDYLHAQLTNILDPNNEQPDLRIYTTFDPLVITFINIECTKYYGKEALVFPDNYVPKKLINEVNENIIILKKRLSNLRSKETAENIVIQSQDLFNVSEIEWELEFLLKKKESLTTFTEYKFQPEITYNKIPLEELISYEINVKGLNPEDELYKLSKNVMQNYLEDGIDEITGEIVSIQRKGVLLSKEKNIDHHALELLKEASIETIWVYKFQPLFDLISYEGEYEDGILSIEDVCDMLLLNPHRISTDDNTIFWCFFSYLLKMNAFSDAADIIEIVLNSSLNLNTINLKIDQSHLNFFYEKVLKPNDIYLINFFAKCGKYYLCEKILQLLLMKEQREYCDYSIRYYLYLTYTDRRHKDFLRVSSLYNFNTNDLDGITLEADFITHNMGSVMNYLDSRRSLNE